MTLQRFLQWPSEQTIARGIPDIYESTKKSVIDLLEGATSVCVLADIWTSKAVRAYMGITAHYIDRDFRPRHLLLRVARFQGSHTGEACFKMIVDCLAEFKVKKFS